MFRLVEDNLGGFVLPRRFAIAIDAAAMKDGADLTDDYLADWRRASPVECGDDLDGEAAKLSRACTR